MLHPENTNITFCKTGEAGEIRLVHANSRLPYTVKLASGPVILCGADDVTIAKKQAKVA